MGRPGQRQRVGTRTRSTVAPLALALGVFVLWWWLASRLPAFVLPAPHTVLTALTTALAGPIWPYAAATFLEAAVGCAAGAAVALPLAVAIYKSRWIDAAIQPFLGGTQAIPAIALAPLLVLWVGYGLVPIVLLCALIVFFPILVTSVTGFGNLDRDVLDAARVDGTTSAQRLRYIELPLTLPWIFAGVRNGFTLSVTGAVVGEMVMGGTGLGTLLTVQRDQLNTAGMFATIVVLAALASLAYGLLYLIERRSPITTALRTEE